MSRKTGLDYGPFWAPVSFHDSTSSFKSRRKICAMTRPFTQYESKELLWSACKVVDQDVFGFFIEEDNAVCIASCASASLTRRNSRTVGRPEAI
jgi:hypothetical protein